MAPTAIAKKQTRQSRPRVLVVDDEPSLLEMFRDVMAPRLDCQIVCASDVSEAKRIIEKQPVDLLVTDLHLPGGDGISLLPALREKQKDAGAIVITGQPTVGGAISAIRAGASDFLPKPFSADQLADRVDKALRRQQIVAKTEKRLDRLRDAVRRLNISRRMVTKKVDLLCNDLISAYGELSRQFDDVRHQESFRKLMRDAGDLEQMLCHAMDWILRQAGYANVAVWLASEDDGFQLGAYMKYTIAGDPPLTNAMRNGLVPMAVREGFVHLSAEQAEQFLTPAELAHMKDQSIVAVNCTYLGESLAVLILFRDDKSPLTNEDAALIKAISPIFATTLAAIVHQGEGEESASDDDSDDETGGLLDEDQENRPKKKKETNDADWWKRGEPPPF